MSIGNETSRIAERPGAASPADLTVIVVTWNTRDLTLRCLETLFENTSDVDMRVIVADNNSHDGSADIIAERFPQIDLIRNPGDFGFARANNEAIQQVDSEWILLLNPDTEVHPNAIKNLLAFSKQHPEAGITGGRTVFPDGSLNPTSCWNKMTPWSLFCQMSGLNRIFKNSEFFNAEAIGRVEAGHGPARRYCHRMLVHDPGRRCGRSSAVSIAATSCMARKWIFAFARRRSGTGR